MLEEGFVIVYMLKFFKLQNIFKKLLSNCKRKYTKKFLVNGYTIVYVTIINDSTLFMFLEISQYHSNSHQERSDKNLRRNGTPPLFDVLPFEINNENYFLLIGVMCTN